MTRRMNPAELERKRQEMMASAKERDREREKRVRLYESEMKKEEAEALTSQNDFLKPLKVQSLTSSKTLEDRIHRNINSVQRTRSALNDSFMKRYILHIFIHSQQQPLLHIIIVLSFL